MAQRINTATWIAGLTIPFGLAPLFLPPWLLLLLTLSLASGLATLGVAMQLRAGLLSFGQGLYYCIGGYTVAILNNRFYFHEGAILLVLGVAIALICALIIGPFIVRYRAIFYAMFTLALTMILYATLTNDNSLGSTDGFNVGTWTLFGFEGTSANEIPIYLVTVLCVSVVALVSHYVSQSAMGMACEGVRSNEVRVEYLGLSSHRLLLVTYLLAASVSALGGGVTALASGHVGPDMAYWVTSGVFVFIALLGGTNNVIAPFMAAILFFVVRSYAVQIVPNEWHMIMGIILLIVIVFLPGGLISIGSIWKRRRA